MYYFSLIGQFILPIQTHIVYSTLRVPPLVLLLGSLSLNVSIDFSFYLCLLLQP